MPVSPAWWVARTDCDGSSWWPSYKYLLRNHVTSCGSWAHVVLTHVTSHLGRLLMGIFLTFSWHPIVLKKSLVNVVVQRNVTWGCKVPVNSLIRCLMKRFWGGQFHLVYFHNNMCFLDIWLVNFLGIQKTRSPKGSHPERKVQFFWTLFKRPLTPPPFRLNIMWWIF